MQQKTKVLFILKRREDFDPTKHTKSGMQTGLYNSASFASNMLVAEGVESVMEIAIDNNCIDRLVNKHKPTHVIIEAIWVVPSKFAVLCKLHPTVKWIIRLHSETPFLAQEGVAFDWIGDYARHPNITIAANAPRMLAEARLYLQTAHGWTDEQAKSRVVYLPNYYPHRYKTKSFANDTDVLNVGCFGAVRPLKNHVVQAFAALRFAQSIGKKLHFHINARVETRGDPGLNSLRCIFQHLNDAGHQLVFHEWAPRIEFLDVCAAMDIGMQVSFSETFNIVAADMLSQGVPIIGSYELPWIADDYRCDPTDHADIAKVLATAYENPGRNISLNQRGLSKYSDETRNTWLQYFGE